MLKSLWSGLTGLSAHQKALDVESNNIANANTDGFKYSKVTFEDMINQTYNTAASPNENLGGVNAIQVGLGVKVSSIEKVFSQGPIESTDRITDLSLQGDGFFMVSSDNAKTQEYTRDGQFKFDASGTLVNNNGLKVLGWQADKNFNINSSNKLETITIDPNMKIDSKATNKVTVSANLNNGEKVKETSPSSHPFTKYTDLNDLYDTFAKPFNLTRYDTITVSVKDPNGGANTDYTFTYETDFKSMGDIVDLVNNVLRDDKGENYNTNVYIDGKGRFVDDKAIIDTITSTNSGLNKTFEPLQSYRVSEPLKDDKTNFYSSDDVSELYTDEGNKINLRVGQGITVDIEGLKEPRNFVYRDKDITDYTDRFNLDGNYQNNADMTTATAHEGFHWTKDENGNPANLNVGDKITIDYQDSDNPGATTQTLTFEYGVDFATMEEFTYVVNDALPQTETGGLQVNNNTGQIDKLGDFIKDITVTSVLDDNGATLRPPNGNNGLNTFKNLIDDLIDTNHSGTFYQNNTYYFSDTQNLENLIQKSINESGDKRVNNNSNSAHVIMEDGKITIDNIGDNSFGINIKGYPDLEHENQQFTNIMMGINALSVPGNKLQTKEMRAATHIITTDVFDSFGNSQPVSFSFTKAETDNKDGFIVWNWKADITEPARFTGTTAGEIRFAQDGSLYSYTPAALTFMSSDTKQGVPTTFNVDFGNIGDVDGIISQAGDSKTNKVFQDGYTRGELEDMTIDKYGIVNGVFSNGINKKLAQVGLATFTNNSGLENMGGNLYRSSSNSGLPDISTAGEPGVAAITSSSLEKSNVDLSKALVAMIVFQRGFQANSKTISTADEILKEMIGLKR